jgi:hypothetical protein
MKLNVGKTDRIFRVVLGLALLLMVVVGPQTPWGFIGLIPLVTGLFGRCALYSMLGISTSEKSA